MSQPLDITCPNCNAPAGHSCTRPTETGRVVVGWFHSAREDAAEQGKQDFLLTFGLQYATEPHPTWPECNPKGYVRITATDYEAARAIAVERFGLDWSVLTPAWRFERRYFPAGEVMTLP
jgi:hypothetical protein